MTLPPALPCPQHCPAASGLGFSPVLQPPLLCVSLLSPVGCLSLTTGIEVLEALWLCLVLLGAGMVPGVWASVE